VRIAMVSMESLSPYSQSRYYTSDEGGSRLTDKNGRETESSSDHEKRTWRMRCHTTDDWRIFMPPMAFKNALSEAAKYLSMSIKGKGKSTYTKHFEAGVMCMDPIVLPDKAADVAGDWLFVPSDGKRGSGSRVMKCFPVIKQWAGEMPFYVVDDVISKEVFETHIKTAGALIGVGRFRPRQNGFFGRFKVKSIAWREADFAE
jgi:hypothetical protein